MKKGFTLVELLIVIIIIGILATMAMPQYQKMVNRARWAECMTLSSAIKTAQSLYYAEYGVYSTGNLTALNTLDLPNVVARKFRFTVKISNYVYGYSTVANTADDLAAAPATNFYINLTTNTTGYSGNAPGSLN